MTRNSKDNNLQVFDRDKHRTRRFLRVIQRVKIGAILEGQDKCIGFLDL